jgi:hypothetical protein
MFENLQIAIPSRSRPNRQLTLYNISQYFWPKTCIVVPEYQYTSYRNAIPLEVEVVPFSGEGIGNKRQFILTSRPTGKLIMFDDDLTFYHRISDDKFAKMAREDCDQMMTDIVTFLDRYPMVGMVDKFMSHTRPRGHIECSRFNKVLAFNRDMLPIPWPRFRLPHDEEHDVHLQLLTRGYKTAVMTEYSKSDPVQAPGGCTDWRSPEVFAETYRLLTEYWPSIVNVYDKEDKEGNTSTRVGYRWKEAMRIGGLR